MDEIDRAQFAQERDNHIALLEHKRRAIQKVSTGICEECEAVIPQARIDAVNATTCIECAREEESRDKKWGR